MHQLVHKNFDNRLFAIFNCIITVQCHYNYCHTGWCSIPGKCRRTLSPPEWQTVSGVRLTSWRLVTRIISPEKKRPKCTPDRLLPYNGKIKNAWSYYSTPPDFMPPCLTSRQRASCFIGEAFRYSPENAFYIFNQQIYFII